MSEHNELFIKGAMSAATGTQHLHVIDSYTEEVFSFYRSASHQDVNYAVAAARQAWPSWSSLPVSERAAAVRRIGAALMAHATALTDTITREVGMPHKLTSRIQVEAPINAWATYADLADVFEWEAKLAHSLVRQVSVGVVACITPWNYPLHQMTHKVAPALLAGCTVVLKPSELAPFSAYMLAKAIQEAELPPGVFNLVYGSGSDVGEQLVRHPDIDMISFTGSTRAGQQIASIAGHDIKRLALELGGKSASLILPGADVATAVKVTLAQCMLNSGQTCSAMTRLLVPHSMLKNIEHLVLELLPNYRMGDPADSQTRLGPLISKDHQQKVLRMIANAIDDGAIRLGEERTLPRNGYFVPATVLSNVSPTMAIANEEVFGPVLCIITYDDVNDGIALANSTDYGLAAAVWGPVDDTTLEVAKRIRAGQVDVNGAHFNPIAPFGGFKKSGIGRENGQYGLAEFLEPVSIQLPAAFLDLHHS